MTKIIYSTIKFLLSGIGVSMAFVFLLLLFIVASPFGLIGLFTLKRKK